LISNLATDVVQTQRNFAFSIYTLHGEMALRGQATDNRIDVSTLSPGSYVIVSRDESKSVAEKFVISR
jgi:Secretion system C-terminal sorting domain